MRVRIGIVVLTVLAIAASAAAQARGNVATINDLYCSGVVRAQTMPRDTHIISGEDSYVMTGYRQGDKVFINRGSSHGTNVGDEFMVMREAKDRSPVKWFRGQGTLMRAMGRLWTDVGRVKVTEVRSNVSIAEVVFTCDMLQRGDTIRPFAAMSSPAFPEGPIDRFGQATGKSVGMVVFAKNYGQMVGTYDIVYVNLGSSQGVSVGDHIRVFRYQNTTHEVPYRPRGTAYQLWGWGSTPLRYTWGDLPREVLAHGVVLRVGENAATVLLTNSLKDIYLGDYVELK